MKNRLSYTAHYALSRDKKSATHVRSSKQFLRSSVTTAILLCITATSAFADVLDLRTVEEQSLIADPLSQAFRERAHALADRSISDGQLSDPTVSLGALNYPTDSFAGDQEAMTQLKIGLTQQFPSYGTLSARSDRTKALSRVEFANEKERKLSILKTVRLTWLDAYLWQETAVLLHEYKNLIRDDIRSVQSSFGAGKLTVQRVVQAELKESGLDDRILRARRELSVLKSELGKWVGRDVSTEVLPSVLPDFPMPAAKEIADAKIVGHPAVIAQREKEKAARQSIKLAEADYLPKFGAGVSYGYRQGSPMGADRSDFASVNVTMSLPIFTGARQDRRLSASKFEAAAAKRRMDELLRVLRGNYDAELHAYDLTKERLRNLVNNTLPRAKENVSAAVASYQFDKTDFNALTGAHIAELEVRLQQLRLNVEQEKSLVKLQYLTGGTDHE